MLGANPHEGDGSANCSASHALVLESLLTTMSGPERARLVEMCSTVSTRDTFSLYKPIGDPIEGLSPSTIFERYFHLVEGDCASTAELTKLKQFLQSARTMSEKLGFLQQMQLKSTTGEDLNGSSRGGHTGDTSGMSLSSSSYVAPASHPLFEATSNVYPQYPSATSRVAEKILDHIVEQTKKSALEVGDEESECLQRLVGEWAEEINNGGAANVVVMGFPIETYSRETSYLSRNQLRPPEVLEKTFHHIVHSFLRCPRMPARFRKVLYPATNRDNFVGRTDAASASSLGEDMTDINMETYDYVDYRFRRLAKDWIQQVDFVAESRFSIGRKLLAAVAPSAPLAPMESNLLRHCYHAYLNERRAAVHEAIIRFHLVSSVLATQGCQGETQTLSLEIPSLNATADGPSISVSISAMNRQCKEFAATKKVSLLEALNNNFSFLTQHYRLLEKNTAAQQHQPNSEMRSILLFHHCMQLKEKAESTSGFCRVVGAGFEPPEDATKLDFKELDYLQGAGKSPDIRSMLMLIQCVASGDYCRFFEVFNALSSLREEEGGTDESETTNRVDGKLGVADDSTNHFAVDDSSGIALAMEDLRAFGSTALAGGASAALSVYSPSPAGRNRRGREVFPSSKIPSTFHRLTLCQKAIAFSVFSYVRFRAVLQLLLSFASCRDAPTASTSLRDNHRATSIPIATLSTMLLFREDTRGLNLDDDDGGVASDAVRYADCVSFLVLMGLGSRLAYVTNADDEEDNGSSYQQLVFTLSSEKHADAASQIVATVHAATDGTKSALLFPAATDLFFYTGGDSSFSINNHDDSEEVEERDSGDSPQQGQPLEASELVKNVRREFLCPLSPVEFIDRYLITPLLSSPLFSARVQMALVGTSAVGRPLRTILAMALGRSTYGSQLLTQAGFVPDEEDDDGNRIISTRWLLTAVSHSFAGGPPIWVDTCAVIDASLPPLWNILNHTCTPLAEEQELAVILRGQVSGGGASLFSPVLPSVEMSRRAVHQVHTLLHADALCTLSDTARSMIESDYLLRKKCVVSCESESEHEEDLPPSNNVTSTTAEQPLEQVPPLGESKVTMTDSSVTGSSNIVVDELVSQSVALMTSLAAEVESSIQTINGIIDEAETRKIELERDMLAIKNKYQRAEHETEVVQRDAGQSATGAVATFGESTLAGGAVAADPSSTVPTSSLSTHQEGGTNSHSPPKISFSFGGKCADNAGAPTNPFASAMASVSAPTLNKPPNFFSTRPPEHIAGIGSTSDSSSADGSVTKPLSSGFSVKALFGSSSSSSAPPISMGAAGGVSPATITVTNTANNSRVTNFFSSASGGIPPIAVAAPGFGEDAPTPPTPLVGFASTPTPPDETARTPTSMQEEEDTTTDANVGGGFSFKPLPGSRNHTIGGSPQPFKPMSDADAMAFSRNRRRRDDGEEDMTLTTTGDDDAAANSTTDGRNTFGRTTTIPNRSNPFLALPPPAAKPFSVNVSEVTSAHGGSPAPLNSFNAVASGEAKPVVSEPRSEIDGRDGAAENTMDMMVAAPHTPLLTVLSNGTTVAPMKPLKPDVTVAPTQQQRSCSSPRPTSHSLPAKIFDVLLRSGYPLGDLIREGTPAEPPQASPFPSSHLDTMRHCLALVMEVLPCVLPPQPAASGRANTAATVYDIDQVEYDSGDFPVKPLMREASGIENHVFEVFEMARHIAEIEARVVDLETEARHLENCRNEIANELTAPPSTTNGKPIIAVAAARGTNVAHPTLAPTVATPPAAESHSQSKGILCPSKFVFDGSKRPRDSKEANDQPTKNALTPRFEKSPETHSKTNVLEGTESPLSSPSSSSIYSTPQRSRLLHSRDGSLDSSAIAATNARLNMKKEPLDVSNASRMSFPTLDLSNISAVPDVSSIIHKSGHSFTSLLGGKEADSGRNSTFAVGVGNDQSSGDKFGSLLSSNPASDVRAGPDEGNSTPSQAGPTNTSTVNVSVINGTLCEADNDASVGWGADFGASFLAGLAPPQQPPQITMPIDSAGEVPSAAVVAEKNVNDSLGEGNRSATKPVPTNSAPTTPQTNTIVEVASAAVHIAPNVPKTKRALALDLRKTTDQIADVIRLRDQCQSFLEDSQRHLCTSLQRMRDATNTATGTRSDSQSASSMWMWPPGVAVVPYTHTLRQLQFVMGGELCDTPIVTGCLGIRLTAVVLTSQKHAPNYVTKCISTLRREDDTMWAQKYKPRKRALPTSNCAGGLLKRVFEYEDATGTSTVCAIKSLIPNTVHAHRIAFELAHYQLHNQAKPSCVEHSSVFDLSFMAMLGVLDDDQGGCEVSRVAGIIRKILPVLQNSPSQVSPHLLLSPLPDIASHTANLCRAAGLFNPPSQQQNKDEELRTPRDGLHHQSASTPVTPLPSRILNSAPQEYDRVNAGDSFAFGNVRLPVNGTTSVIVANHVSVAEAFELNNLLNDLLPCVGELFSLDNGQLDKNRSNAIACAHRIFEFRERRATSAILLGNFFCVYMRHLIARGLLDHHNVDSNTLDLFNACGNMSIDGVATVLCAHSLLPEAMKDTLVTSSLPYVIRVLQMIARELAVQFASTLIEVSALAPSQIRAHRLFKDHAGLLEGQFMCHDSAVRRRVIRSHILGLCCVGVSLFEENIPDAAAGMLQEDRFRVAQNESFAALLAPFKCFNQ